MNSARLIVENRIIVQQEYLIRRILNIIQATTLNLAKFNIKIALIHIATYLDF